MKRNKTYSAKKELIEKKWYLIDAKDKVLGRLAVQIADILRGKNNPFFTPNVDTGDFVVVINAKDIKVTGNKLKDKYYFRHSGYPGGDKKVILEDQLKSSPQKVILHAVKGMLPKGRLGDKILTKLKVYKDGNYLEKAQQPIAVGRENGN